MKNSAEFYERQIVLLEGRVTELRQKQTEAYTGATDIAQPIVHGPYLTDTVACD